MFLCRDFDGERIFYYWVRSDCRAEKLSSHLPSIALAREWYIRFIHNRYSGDERRIRITDRRFIPRRRRDISRTLDRDRRQQTGRRCTDRPVKVAIDLAAGKLNQYRLPD